MAIGVLISSFQYVGMPVLNATFGFFKAPSSSQIQRIQISAQTVPIGGSVTIQLVDGNGTAYAGGTATLGPTVPYYDQPLAAPITLRAGQIVRALITAIDTGIASDISVNLIGATSQGGNAPSGCCPPNECQPPSAQLLFFKGNVSQEVEQAAAYAAEAAASATQASESASASAISSGAADGSKTAAETAASAAAASVVQAANWATNANNAAAAANVYLSQAASQASSAAVSATSAAASAAEAQSGHKGATLQLTPGSTQTIPDATPTAVQWNNAQFDDLIFFDPVNPTRLTIPTGRGIQRVRLIAGVRWDASTVGNRSLQIRSNPAGLYLANTIVGSNERPTGATGDIQVQTGTIRVEDGMYFEVIAEQDSGGGLDINTATADVNVANFFSIEVINRA